jgi:putative aldouronate transport system permease protein
VDGAGPPAENLARDAAGLTPVITIMFIFAVGQLLSDDFDQVFNMYNSAVYSVADVLSTYTLPDGACGNQLQPATAVGLFRNVIAFILVVTTNAVTIAHQ